MSSSQMKLSFKDIIPTHPEPYAPQLLAFADYLYLLSLQKNPVLPNRAEIARCHLCAYLAAEKYQLTLKLPEPSVSKIPVQPKLVDKFLDDFRVSLLNQERSASSTPKSSPTKRRQRTLNYTTPTSSPSKIQKLSPSKPNTPKISSPLKKLQALRDQELKQTLASKLLGINDEESIFNQKDESEPVSDTPNTPSTPSTKYVKRQITIADFISFANNFYIPASITPKMVESFVAHKYKFTKKNEWLLACGMINAAYTRINHQLLQKTIGAKSQFQHQLFQYQKGGLMRWNMLLWCNIIEDAIKDEPWISEIEQNYIFGKSLLNEDVEKQETDAKLGSGWNLPEIFGTMIHPNVQFNLEAQEIYYKTWTTSIIANLDN